MHRIEPEQEREPELRRAPPAGQLLQLIPDQRPIPDQLVIVQHARHELSGSHKVRCSSNHLRQRMLVSTTAARHDDRPPEGLIVVATLGRQLMISWAGEEQAQSDEADGGELFGAAAR